MIIIRKQLKRLLKNQSGAAAIEFSFVMPLMIVIIFAILNFGILFFGVHQAQRASEASARQIRMMDMPSNEDILTVLEANLAEPMSGTYSSTVKKIAKHGGTYADLKITYDFVVLIPLADKFPISVDTGTQILLRDMPH